MLTENDLVMLTVQFELNNTNGLEITDGKVYLKNIPQEIL